jgi:hypothetical protein
MKTILLMGISCLMLAGVYGVMSKQHVVSKVLSFNQSNNAVSITGANELEKTAATDSAKKKATTSNTLDDSHWIDDPLFEKAAGSELLTETEATETTVPEATGQAAPQKGGEEPVKEPKPEIKQLILELNPDTAAPRKILTDVV